MGSIRPLIDKRAADRFWSGRSSLLASLFAPQASWRKNPAAPTPAEAPAPLSTSGETRIWSESAPVPSTDLLTSGPPGDPSTELSGGPRKRKGAGSFFAAPGTTSIKI